MKQAIHKYHLVCDNCYKTKFAISIMLNPHNTTKLTLCGKCMQELRALLNGV